jgi:hypothetical protein
MVTTKHSLARMSQRGLFKNLIDLVFEYGEGQGDKLILNKKPIQKMIKELDTLGKGLIRIMDKGGVTIVCDGETLITAYNSKSYQRR